MKQTTQTPEAEGKNSTERGIPAYSEETILFDVGSVCEHLSRLTDGRKARGKRYTLTTLLVIMLMAKLSGAGVMLMQIELAAGEGELTVAPRLLRVLDLQGKIVTGDAAFTQRNLSIQIVEAGGDYVWKVKDNQPKLLSDI